MRNWLAAPQTQGEAETQKFAVTTLHYTLLLLIVVAFGFVFLANEPAQLIFIPVIETVFIGCYYLLHTGRFQLASSIFLSGLWLVITIASFSINGIRNASLSGYAIVIIYSAILFNDRAVVLLTGLSIGAVVILAVGENLDVLPFNTMPLHTEDRLFQLIALFGSSGILLSGASRVVRNSIQHVVENEQILIEKNRELERQINERQRTEASLRTSEEKYGLLFENTPIMATIYGKDGDIHLLNKASAETFGNTPESIQGRNIRELIDPEDAEYAIARHLEVMEAGKPALNEETVTLPGDRNKVLLRHIIPLPDPEGHPASQVLVLTSDLTERHLAAQRERELQLARDRNAFLTEFFGTVSHDLKTPLTTMNTSLYLLEKAITHAQRLERIAKITEQVALMDKYIQDMLTISRLEHLPTTLYESLNINALIDELVRLFMPRLEGKNLVFQSIKAPDFPNIQGDQEQIRRMLTNLIENAINYTPEGGEITIKTFRKNDHAVLEVSDSGIGIEQEAIPLIFERFFRTEDAKHTERTGTGLGLAIVNKVAQMHNAQVQVHSTVGQGTTFTIDFPTEISP